MEKGQVYYIHFYPRSPCGERPQSAPRFTPAANFYPRSPCGERRISSTRIIGFSAFLSTLSLRRATKKHINGRADYIISIHALLAESDSMMPLMGAILILFLSTLSLRRATRGKVTGGYDRSDFYPRSPCGERRECWTALNHLSRFLSTLSLRRATISTRRGASKLIDFYPRSPCGERRPLRQL